MAQRLQIQGQVYGQVITDPVLRNAQGIALLSQAATREANVRAYNDVVVLNTFIALAFLAWSLFQTLIASWKAITAARVVPAAQGTD